MGERVSEGLVIESWEDVDRRGRELGQLRSKEAVNTAKMNAEMDAVKMRWAPVIKPLQEEIALRERGIEDFYRTHQRDLGEARSFAGTWVRVKARLTSKLCTLPKWTWEKVVGALRRVRPEWIRVKEEVDKEAIKGAGLAEEELRGIGLKIVREDSVTIETGQAVVSNQ